MARIQLKIPDEDRDRFVRRARREGMTLSAWLRAAGRERLEARQRVERFESPEDLKRFFKRCDEREGPGVEPDWEEHKRNIEASRLHGLPKRMIFADTNIFMYAVGKPHPLKARAQQFFDEAMRNRKTLFTSAEVIQERIHVYLRMKRPHTLDLALELMDKVGVAAGGG